MASYMMKAILLIIFSILILQTISMFFLNRDLSNAIDIISVQEQRIHMLETKVQDLEQERMKVEPVY